MDTTYEISVNFQETAGAVSDEFIFPPLPHEVQQAWVYAVRYTYRFYLIYYPDGRALPPLSPDVSWLEGSSNVYGALLTFSEDFQVLTPRGDEMSHGNTAAYYENGASPWTMTTPHDQSYIRYSELIIQKPWENDYGVGLTERVVMQYNYSGMNIPLSNPFGTGTVSSNKGRSGYDDGTGAYFIGTFSKNLTIQMASRQQTIETAYVPPNPLLYLAALSLFGFDGGDARRRIWP